MASECEECGVTSSGAFIVEVDDRDLCTDCAGEQACERCGRPTNETTLAGDFRCRDCQQSKRQQDTTRESGQAGLGEWSR
jgi:hypothetical protein